METQRRGRFTVTAAPETQEANQQRPSGPPKAPKSETSTSQVGSCATSQRGPSSEGSGAQHRLGRFTVTGVSEDGLTDDTPTTPDSGSLCPERERFDLGPDVFAFLDVKQKEVGALFDKMRAQIFQVMAGQAAPGAPTGKHATTPPFTGGMPNASPLIRGDNDEALNLWGELGKPIERAIKKNRQLEDENLRLRQEVAQKKLQLQSLQERFRHHPVKPSFSRSVSASTAGGGSPPVGPVPKIGIPVAQPSSLPHNTLDSTNSLLIHCPQRLRADCHEKHLPGLTEMAKDHHLCSMLLQRH